MSWRDNLLKASFRDADFYVVSSDYGIGRRNIIHQYPFKNTPYAEDLGMDTDEFVINGYILGAAYNDYDYMKERDALISALKKKGAGRLVHPFLGERMVVTVGKARIRETFSEGGIARFTMTFAISGASVYPKGNVEPIGKVDEVVNVAVNTASDSFYKQYSITNLPSFLKDSMVDDFSAYIDMVKMCIASIRSTGSAALTNVKSDLDDIRDLLLDVVYLPCQIASLVVDTIDSILEIANILGTGYLGYIVGHCSNTIQVRKLSSDGKSINQELGITMYQSLLEISGNSETTGFGTPSDSNTSIAGGLTEIEVTTKSRARQAANRLAFVNMVRVLCLSAALRVIIRTNFKSFTLAKEAQDSAVESIDYLLLKLGDESASDLYSNYNIYTDNIEMFNELEKLRAEFISAMRQVQLTLPKEIEYVPPVDGITTLQVSYDKYRDLDRSESIFERNQPVLNHPGFIGPDSIRILTS